MLPVHRFIRSAACKVVRNFSSVQTATGSCRRGLLKINLSEGTGSKRLMSGHGPDISKFQAALYILVGGGGFAVFGMYQAKSMRNRIEAFETGKTIPFKTMSDDEFLVYKEKYRKIHSDDEEDDEDPETSDEDAAVEEVAYELAHSDPVTSESEGEEDDPVTERLNKDTIIFVEAPKE